MEELIPTINKLQVRYSVPSSRCSVDSMVASFFIFPRLRTVQRVPRLVVPRLLVSALAGCILGPW